MADERMIELPEQTAGGIECNVDFNSDGANFSSHNSNGYSIAQCSAFACSI
jgi:hypothetical protein